MEDEKRVKDSENTSDDSLDNNDPITSGNTLLLADPQDDRSTESNMQIGEDMQPKSPPGKLSLDNDKSREAGDERSTVEPKDEVEQDQQNTEVPIPTPETSSDKEPEPEPQKEKVTPRTVSPKRMVKRKAAEKFKVKSMRIREVYIESCRAEDQTLQMQPEMKRRMKAILSEGRSTLKAPAITSMVELRLETSDFDKAMDTKPLSGALTQQIVTMMKPPVTMMKLPVTSTKTPNTLTKLPITTVVPCLKCNERFLSQSSFRAHVCRSEVLRPGLYSCTDCDGKFDSKGHLMKHMQVYHSVKQRRTFTCRFCHATFRQRSKQSEHVRNVHGDFVVYSCDHCDETYLSRIELSRHEKEMLHGDWYPLRGKHTADNATGQR